jgi:transcriptional regulator with XRE-family HTH domain
VDSPDTRIAEMARRLRITREWRGLSQERLAERAGVSRQHLTAVEAATAYPRVDRLLALCDELEVDIRDLFGPTFTLPR